MHFWLHPELQNWQSWSWDRSSYSTQWMCQIGSCHVSMTRRGNICIKNNSAALTLTLGCLPETFLSVLKVSQNSLEIIRFFGLMCFCMSLGVMWEEKNWESLCNCKLWDVSFFPFHVTFNGTIYRCIWLFLQQDDIRRTERCKKVPGYLNPRAIETALKKQYSCLGNDDENHAVFICQCWNAVE